MQNTASTDRLRLIGALAVVAVAAVIWATAAFAGGSSSSGNSEPSESPAPAFVQDRGNGSAEDCPERQQRGDENPDASSNL